MRGRRRQRGFTTLAVVLYSGLIAAGYAFWALVVAGTFYVAAKLRPVTVILVACFWLWAWSYTSFWGIGPQKWAMRIAVPACEDDIARLPKAIATDGVLDESAFLTLENVESLLMLRKLDFVEVLVQPDPRAGARYLHPSQGDPLRVSRRLVQGQVVKLELGQRGEASCGWATDASRLEAGACIRVNGSDKAMARYSVRHSMDNIPIPAAVGNWILFDRIRGLEVARISTYDSPAQAQLGNPATIEESGALKDCRGAHALFFGRLDGRTVRQ